MARYYQIDYDEHPDGGGVQAVFLVTCKGLPSGELKVDIKDIIGKRIVWAQLEDDNRILLELE